MGQIKKRVIVKSLKTKFAQYIFFYLLASLVMSFALSNLFFGDKRQYQGNTYNNWKKTKGRLL